MDIIFGHLALMIAAAFAGAAIYVSFAEQPARLRLDDKALLTEWKPSYKRGFAMQGPLALAGSLCGLIAWYEKGEADFLWGALLLLANWPRTLIAIMPTNSMLTRMVLADPNPEARALIKKWGALHAVRAILGSLAAIAFFFACVSS